jgi:hypothetical protein
MEKDYLFIVHTTKPFVDGGNTKIPEGSGIYVEKELKNCYTGIWSSAFGSFIVKIPKDICVKFDEKDSIKIDYDTEEFRELAAHIAEIESSRMY